MDHNAVPRGFGFGFGSGAWGWGTAYQLKGGA